MNGIFTPEQNEDFGEGTGLPLAILCFLAAPLVIVIGITLVVLLSQIGLAGPAATVFVPLSVMAAWKLVRLGQRLKVPSARQILEKDKRPPVLYIRPFESDTRTVTPLGGYTEYWPGWTFHTQRLEERNTKIFKNLGPVIAVASPRDKLSQLGAARVAFDEGKWQGGVRELMKKSQLIVIESGVSSGLKWEMSEVFQQRPFKPVLICGPVREEDALLTMQQRYEVLRRALPEEATRFLPLDIGNTTFFFFKEPDKVSEIEAEGGPPEEILDEVRPGATAEMHNRRTRRFFVVVAIIVGLWLLLLGVHGH